MDIVIRMTKVIKSRAIKTSLVLLFSFGLLSACAVNPVTGKQELSLVSEQEEISIGKQNYLPAQQSQGGEYTVDKELTEYVNSVGQQLVKVSDRPSLPYEFVVLNNGVPNAWALPGGKIALNRGLLLELNNEAELAAVLSHEIVHAAARHGAKSVERGMLFNIGLIGIGAAVGDEQNADLIVGAAGVSAGLISKKYGRDAELESDRYGMEYMVRAGYNPEAAVALQETFVRLSEGKKSNWLQGLFASHPPSPERVAANRQHVQRLGAKGKLGAEEYQAKIAHLKKTKPAYEAHDKGRKALQEKKPDQALDFAAEAIRIEPREALFYTLQGDAWQAKEQPDKAEASYTQAIEYNENLFAPYLQRGLARTALGKDALAAEDLEHSAKLLPTAPAYLGLGNLASRTGDAQKAINYYRQATASNTASGKQAGAELAHLDLAHNPQNYFHIQANVGTQGTLILTLKNNAAVGVKNIKLDVAFTGTGNQVISSKVLTLENVIAAGKFYTLDTGLVAPPRDKSSLKVKITHAETVH